MGCGASVGKKHEYQIRVWDSGASATEKGNDVVNLENETDCSVYLDWTSCEFDIFMPKGLQGKVPDNDWNGLIWKINFELLEPFAKKWRAPGLAESIARNALKSAVRTTIEELGRFAVPLPVHLALSAVGKVGQKIETMERRKEWDDQAAPAILAYLALANKQAESRGGGCAALSDARLSPTMVADLQARRAKVQATAAIASTQSTKLDELAKVFNDKVELVAAKIKEQADEVEAKVGEAAPEKAFEKLMTGVPCITFSPPPATESLSLS